MNSFLVGPRKSKSKYCNFFGIFSVGKTRDRPWARAQFISIHLIVPPKVLSATSRPAGNLQLQVMVQHVPVQKVIEKQVAVAVLPFMPEGLIFSHWKRPAINGLLCYFMQVFSLFISLCVYLCMYQTCVYLWIYLYVYIYTHINGCVKWTCIYIYCMYAHVYINIDIIDINLSLIFSSISKSISRIQYLYTSQRTPYGNNTLW